VARIRRSAGPGSGERHAERRGPGRQRCDAGTPAVDDRYSS